MSDTISRQKTIVAIDEYDFGFSNYMEWFVTELRDVMKADLKRDIEALPSAQTERKKGKWIPYSPEGLRHKCSECESRYDTPWHFCPNCGSYNGGGQSEID